MHFCFATFTFTTKLDLTLSIQKFTILDPVFVTFVVLPRNRPVTAFAELKLQQTCILLHKSAMNLNKNKH